MSKENKRRYAKLLLITLLLAAVCSLSALFIKAEKPGAKNISITQEAETDIASAGCGGVERWKVKVFTDSLANTIDFTPKPSTIAHLVSLSIPLSYFTMPRFQPVEDSTYTITCAITIKKIEADSDFHLALSDGINTLIGEIPDPECPSVSASPKVNEFIAARNWVNANIAAGNVFNVNLPPVEVTGVAFIDTMHGQTGAAPNQLELHSIIDIHFISATGIAGVTDHESMMYASPNPFSTATIIHYAVKPGDITNPVLTLYDITGRAVQEIALPSGKKEGIYILQKGYLNPGIYIYCIRQRETVLHSDKLIVE